MKGFRSDNVSEVCQLPRGRAAGEAARGGVHQAAPAAQQRQRLGGERARQRDPQGVRPLAHRGPQAERLDRFHRVILGRPELPSAVPARACRDGLQGQAVQDLPAGRHPRTVRGAESAVGGRVLPALGGDLRRNEPGSACSDRPRSGGSDRFLRLGCGPQVRVVDPLRQVLYILNGCVGTKGRNQYKPRRDRA